MPEFTWVASSYLSIDDLDDGTRARQRTMPDSNVICTMSVRQGLSFGPTPDVRQLHPVMYHTVPRPDGRIDIGSRWTCHYIIYLRTVPAYGTSTGWSDGHPQTSCHYFIYSTYVRFLHPVPYHKVHRTECLVGIDPRCRIPCQGFRLPFQ